MNGLLKDYEVGDFFDEMFSAPGKVRPHYELLAQRLCEMEEGELERKCLLAEKSYLNQGITFTVYSGDEGTERIFPFDLIPRIIPSKEWEHIERGLVQRLAALNLFLHDIYHVPRMIKFYLGEEPILPNIKTCLTSDEFDQKYVLENLRDLVIKAANESGGYGMLIGPHATKADIEKFRAAILADPRGYVTQPVINLSRSPSFCDGRAEGRHIDLRPYIISGEKTSIIPGGLHRQPD